MGIIHEYWQELVAIVGLIVVLARMHTDIDVLKEKVKVAFDLINKLREKN
jgi:hypothetical protein